MPTAKEVNDFVGLEVFKGEEGRRLLLSISSMRCGKGIPTAKQVNDFVGMDLQRRGGQGYCFLFPPCVMAKEYPLPRGG